MARRLTQAVRRAVAALALGAAPVAMSAALAEEEAFALPEQGVEVARAPDTLQYYSAKNTPLERHPIRLANFETANVLPEGAYRLYIGSTQTNPRLGMGTGNQMYFAGVSYGFMDGLTVGLEYQNYDDPTFDPILGAYPDVTTQALALVVKYQAFDWGNVSVAGQASVEYFQFFIDLPGATSPEGAVAGSLKLPVTYKFSPQLQFHVTPSVAFLPGEQSGVTSYGTIFSVGAGASFKPSARLAFYGTVEFPFGSGGNTFSDTGTLENVLVWAAGARWTFTPKAALDLYLSNGVGTTPATSTLTHWPSGDDLMFGIKLTYTPGTEWSSSYRGRPAPVSARDVMLQEDGFTLDSADTVEPGTVHLAGWYGSSGNYGAALRFGPDRDLEGNLIVEQLGDDGSVPPALFPSTALRYMAGVKLRFLDQNNGDPISLSARGLFGRRLSNTGSNAGVFYASVTAAYTFSDMLTVTASPKLAAFGSTELYGVGLGVNWEVFGGLSLIAEATPVFGDSGTAVYAAGVRYDVPFGNFVIDLTASNATGRYGIGGLIGQDSIRYGVGISTAFNLR